MIFEELSELLFRIRIAWNINTQNIVNFKNIENYETFKRILVYF
jgi:hypothetical protein